MAGCAFAELFGWHGWSGTFLFLVLLSIAVYGVIRLLGPGKGHADRRDSLEILKRRLAAGEISLEEFKTLRQHL